MLPISVRPPLRHVFQIRPQCNRCRRQRMSHLRLICQMPLLYSIHRQWSSRPLYSRPQKPQSVHRCRRQWMSHLWLICQMPLLYSIHRQ